MRTLTRLPSRFKLLFVFTVLFLAMVAGVGWNVAAVKAVEDDLMTPFPINGSPTNLVVESASRTWFTLPEDNAIGSLIVTSTVEYTFTAYTVPTANAQPYDLIYDARGAIWFTEYQGNQIGRLDLATKTFREFPIPTSNSGPTGITLDRDGNVWFGQKIGNKLAKFDPVTETFTEYPYQEFGFPRNVQPEDVIYQPSGCGDYGGGPACIWSTSPTLNAVYYLDLVTLEFYSIPTTILNGTIIREPWQGTIDGEGTLWIITRAGNRIGRYAPGTLSFWVWYTIPTANASPTGIAFNANGNTSQFWFTESSTGRAGQLWIRSSTLQTIRLQDKPLPPNAVDPTSTPAGIAVDPAGDVWIADSSGKRIVRWQSPYFHVNSLPLIQR